MSYDDAITSVPDDHPEGRARRPPPEEVCRDCRTVIRAGACIVSDILPNGTVWGATYCEPCQRWRSQQDLLFDPRSLITLISAPGIR